MCKSIRSPEIASGLIELGAFLSNTTSPAKVTTLSCALADTWSYKKSRLCHFDEIPNLRFEHVVD